MNEVFWDRGKEASRDVHEQLAHSQRVGFIRDQIERYFTLAQQHPEGSKQHRVMARTVEGFARDYQKLTGDVYRREWH